MYALLVTDAGDGQVSLLVSTQVTTSPSTREEVAYVSLLVPTLEPFTFHWKAGVDPPNCALAVKVTDEPVQIVEAVAVIDTVGFTTGFTTTVTLPVMLFVHPEEARLVATTV